MKALIGWTLGIAVWLAVMFAFFLLVARLDDRPCDPGTSPNKCENVSGPGPGNGR